MNHRQSVATAPPSHYYAFQHHHLPPAPAAHYHDPALASLAYRPLQLPLQQPPAAAEHAHHLPPQQHHPLSLAAAAPGHLHTPTGFRPQHLAIRTRQQTLQAQAATAAAMAASFPQQQTAPHATDEELAELQKLSNEYEPEVTGPLVSERQPSTAIANEYASADPILQAKTSALPQKYSHYRTIRGDGRCGWRAVGFGYFETLINLGDLAKFREEEARLRSLSNILNLAGFDPMLYEDFADMAYDLLRRISDNLENGNAEAALLDSFNNEEVQNYFLTYLKTLTAAWMKTRQQEYSPWLLNQSVDEYCNASVMPIGSEIDNVGLSALKDVFLSPAGITLEVLYLDRSEGSEVNMHRFSPINGGYDIGTLRLLYRPGHYDLLYMPQDVPPVSVSDAIPTFLQYASQPDPVYDNLDVPDCVALIPGMSYALPSQGWMSSSSYASSDFFTPSAPVQQCTQPIPAPSAPAPQPQMQQQAVYVPATPTQLVPPPTQMPQELAIRAVPQNSVPPHPGFQHQLGGPFRPSAWELEPDFVQATSQMPFQTSIFRNSHFNTAHFMNPDFQPEEWHPGDDYVVTTASGKSARHRNSG